MKMNSSRNQADSSRVVVSETSSSPAEMHAKEEVLFTIPGAVVHLIDAQQSLHLATGDFCVIRLNQLDGKGIAVVAKVGEELQWPLAKDEATTKLDKRHYFFTLKVPRRLEEDEDDEEHTLSYGVTFAAESKDSQFQQLDKILQEYSYFAAPSVLRGPSYRKGEFDQKIAAFENKAKEDEGLNKQKYNASDYLMNSILGQHNPPAKPISLPDSTIPANIGGLEGSEEKKKLVEEASAGYWTTVAPSVENYNGSLAKAVAAGSGQIIRGIFWCSDATVSQLEKGGVYLREHMKPKNKPTQVSPRTLKNIKRVKKISKMTQKVTMAVLQGIVTTTGMVSGAFIKSEAGRKLMKMLPGEVALASLDAFGRVFDAVEIAGKNVLTSTNDITSGLVSFRYGEAAGAATKESLATAGHIATTAWTITKIRKALTPVQGVKNPTTELLKSVTKAAKP